ncbi:hypothetical protein NQ315_014783 [Exocentrus adspersus]|uniref:Regulatory protein zeste n=1 Tax=Exocentrus adspersus TaxID=1586481 RepID=A0AAV8VN78_9CUCU|nr:hypothetical protein NQ315_014783 [Exocentrus adspersus]
MEDRKRSHNFTSTEKSFLFRLIAEKYAAVLEDKKTDRASVEKRDSAWKRIEIDFNAVNPSNIFRSANILKKFYCNKKKDIRKKIAEEKKDVLLTGGGPPTKIFKPDDEADAILLSIVNEKTLHGLPNPFDSDVQTHDSDEIHDATEYPVDLEYELSNPNLEDNVKNINQDSTLKDTSLNWKSHTPADLRTTKNPVLEVSENTPSRTSGRRPTTAVKTLTSSHVAEKYNILLDRRLVLVEQQIEQGKEEHLLTVRKRKLEIALLEEELKVKRSN